jgi:hypothetical protein
VAAPLVSLQTATKALHVSEKKFPRLGCGSLGSTHLDQLPRNSRPLTLSPTQGCVQARRRKTWSQGPKKLRHTSLQCPSHALQHPHLTCAEEGPAAITRPAGGLRELVGRHLVENPSNAAVAFAPPPRGARWGFPTPVDGRTQAVQYQGPADTAKHPSEWPGTGWSLGAQHQG